MAYVTDWLDYNTSTLGIQTRRSVVKSSVDRPGSTLYTAVIVAKGGSNDVPASFSSSASSSYPVKGDARRLVFCVPNQRLLPR
jgi:hypothetical protein